MRALTKLCLAGAAALAFGSVAVAAADHGHVLNVAMPDGSVAQIHYVGNVPPKVVVAPDAMPVTLVAADPFAMMDRIADEMDRRMDGMMQQASLMANAAPGANGQVSAAALQSLPAGMISYSFTSYSSGNGANCSQSVQVTALGTGHAPKVVRQSAGDCTAMNSRPATPAVLQAKPETPALTPASLEKNVQTAPKGPVI